MFLCLDQIMANFSRSKDTQISQYSARKALQKMHMQNDTSVNTQANARLITDDSSYHGNNRKINYQGPSPDISLSIK